ncbi:MAG: sulfite exporter TauE/SafE family protein [Sulfurospirillaceae bacterium]|nr:sulfite exporter TauE/SafE family protein [Sulfurospirillaceae bacterium]MDD3462700.1 sulfite exporter TauE/SafE family protein [Sulfurospirillaceae bacterium]
MDTIDFTAIISVAFLGSLGHCIGMCGGFIVAYSSAKIDSSFSKTRQFFSHLAYNLGRIFSYVILGMLFGFVGSVISFSSASTGYFYFAVGLLMVLMGLSLLGKIRFLTSLESSLATNTFVKRLFSLLIRSKSFGSFLGLGMLNGFLPCGLVYFFAVSASATGSVFWGGVVMAIFGLSTVPALMGLGFVVGFLRSGGFREVMIKMASFFIICYGIYISYLGYIALIR